MALKDIMPWHKMHKEEGSRVPARGERRDVLDVFDDLFRSWALAPWALLGREAGGFAPVVNVSETDKDYRVAVELAGLSKDDIEVSVHEGSLTISGEKKKEEKEERESYIRFERSYGSFTRTLPLPGAVNEDGIEARFKDGVLTVTLPKTEEAKGKRVQINGQ